jgi:hypothetical protein
VHSFLKLGHVLAYVRPTGTDARVTLDVHVVSKRNYDLLNLLREVARRSKDERLAPIDRHVKLLKDGGGERRCLSRAGLHLSDHVVPFYHGHNRVLLDRRRTLEPSRVI